MAPTRKSKHASKQRTFSLLRTLGSTALKASGEAIRKKLRMEQDEQLSAAALRLAQGLDDLKGAAMKVGQLLSLSADDSFLPKGWRAALSKLQANATPRAWEEIEPILRAEFPNDWPFRSVEPDAIHAASIAQVHRAVLVDGTPVAVKIRYPGLEANVKTDLNNVKKLLRVANVISSHKKYDELFSEVEQSLMLELDFEHERSFYEFYRRAFLADETIVVPQVYTHACTKLVLTTAWMQGVHLDTWIQAAHAEQDSADLAVAKNWIGQSVLRTLFIEVFQLKTVQTDPNPANFLVLDAGKLGLVDFGAAMHVEQQTVNGYRDLVFASLERDRNKIIEIALSLGFLLPDDTDAIRQLFCEITELIVEPFASETYSWEHCGLSKRVRDKSLQFAVITKFRPPPRSVVFLNRRVLGTQLILEQLGPTLNAREYLDAIRP